MYVMSFINDYGETVSREIPNAANLELAQGKALQAAEYAGLTSWVVEYRPDNREE